jgi:GNAT superfamily N-acetyltransferase
MVATNPSILRPVHESEASSLIALMAEFWSESGFVFDEELARSAVRDILRDSALGQLWFVCGDEGVVGYLAVAFSHSLEFLGRVATIEDFFVRPGDRGQGFGTRALEQLRTECQARGLNVLRVETGYPDCYARARACYSRAGFREDGRIHLVAVLDSP